MKNQSQANKLYELLKDGHAHRTDEIMRVVYGGDHLGIARIGARIHDLKKRGHEVKGWKDKERPALYWYQLIRKDEPEKPKAQPRLFAPQEQKTQSAAQVCFNT
jgi:hypothetical protein